MDVTKPYEFIGFGAMGGPHHTKRYLRGLFSSRPRMTCARHAKGTSTLTDQLLGRTYGSILYFSFGGGLENGHEVGL